MNLLIYVADKGITIVLAAEAAIEIDPDHFPFR
jgi:hypothetical protein